MNRDDFSFVTTKVEADIRSKFVHPHDQKMYDQIICTPSLTLALIFFFFAFSGRSKYAIHKVSSYIIVLSFFISDAKEVNMDEMMEALQSSKVDVLKICTSISVRYKKTTNKIALQLPSKVPTTSKK